MTTGDREDSRALRERLARVEGQIHLESLIIESMDEGLVVVDEMGEVALYNPAAHRMLGPDFLLTDVNTWPQVYDLHKADGSIPIPPEEFPLTRALRGEDVNAVELLMRRPPESQTDSVWLSINARPVHTEHGEQCGAFMILRDITRRKSFEAGVMLRDRAMASTSEGIVITDPNAPDSPLIYVNAGFERLTGYTRQEVLGKNCRFLQGPKTTEAAKQAIRDSVQRRQPGTIELLNYRKNGEPFWNRLSIAPIRDASGKVKHYVGIVSDITERVKIEERLQKTTRELKAANQRLMRNLETAAQVQRALLPEAHIATAGAEFAWRFQPCEKLAGDLLNIAKLDKNHVCMYVLDVSGHGTAAALLSVAVSRLLLPTVSASSLLWKQGGADGKRTIASPADVVNELNNAFPWDPEIAQFFTIVFAVLNCRTRELRYVSAGHPGFIHLPKDGTPSLHRTRGLPVGIAKTSYEERSLTLTPGDRIFFYSDGVTETMNADRELFGEQRVAQVFDENRRRPVEDALSVLLDELETWREGAPLRDDITLLACALRERTA